MKIGVAGTGAVGGYFGGLLQKAGNDVIFLARGKSLEAMQEKGITVDSEVGKITVGGTYTDDYKQLSNVDLLLFCVKSLQTKEIAENLSSILKKDCLILTLQNGVDNEEILSSIFGEKRILSAATYIQASIPEAGVVKQIGVTPKLVIGPLDVGMKDKAKEIASIFQAANIEAYVTRNILKTKWKKLIWNVTFNPLTALVEAKVGALYENGGLNRTAVSLCQEAISVARKAGIEVDEKYYEKVMEEGKFGWDHQTSMLQDKLQGKPMELESICGYIVIKGKALNVDTPVLETIYHLLRYQEQIN